jgi:hypothetical protein
VAHEFGFQLTKDIKLMQTSEIDSCCKTLKNGSWDEVSKCVGPIGGLCELILVFHGEPQSNSQVWLTTS